MWPVCRSVLVPFVVLPSWDDRYHLLDSHYLNKVEMQALVVIYRIYIR
jgi:hypothetical protein